MLHYHKHACLHSAQPMNVSHILLLLVFQRECEWVYEALRMALILWWSKKVESMTSNRNESFSAHWIEIPGRRKMKLSKTKTGWQSQSTSKKAQSTNTLKVNLPVIASIQCKYHICCVNNNYKFIWLAETWIGEERPAANSLKEFVSQNQWFFFLSVFFHSRWRYSIRIWTSAWQSAFSKFHLFFLMWITRLCRLIGSNIQNHQFNEFPINEFS